MSWRDIALIAPDSNLASLEAEVRDVGVALHPVQLRNGVSVQDVTRLLTSQAWDAVWFACHGNRDGVILGNGQVLSTSTLIQLIRNSGARLVVLNTCESEQVAAWIYMQTDCAVICTIADVGDDMAYTTGSLLGRNLSQGMSVEEAFARSKPGDVGLSQRYRLFSRTYTPGQEVTRLMEMITLAQQPLRDDMRDLRAEVITIKRQLSTVDPFRRLAWILGFVAFIAAMPLYLSDVRALLGIPWATALGASLVLWTGSCGCFMYGMGLIGRAPHV
jgi:hypothetical protein